MRNNSNVYLPKARPRNEELELNSKEHVYRQMYETYIANNCKENGDQISTNIPKCVKRGIVKLNKRQEEGKIVINESDKSQLISISSRENYRQQCQQQIGKTDRKLTWKEVEVVKEVAKKQMTAVSNIFRVVENLGEDEERRVRTQMNEQTTVIPQVSSQAKDHKPIPENGIPKVRGVNGASRTMNQRLSDMTNDNLMAMLNADDSAEIQSTEEMLNYIEKLNERIRHEEISSENLVVGSLDVNSLYSSIDVRKAVKMTRERALETSCKLERIDIKLALIYLALTLKPWERVNWILVGVLPRRNTKKKTTHRHNPHSRRG